MPRLPHWCKTVGLCIAAAGVVWLAYCAILAIEIARGSPDGAGLTALGEYSYFVVVLIPIWVGVLIVGSIGVVILSELVALFRRPMREGECRKCSYNLTGNTTDICPECGEPTPTAAQRK